uniref:NB-ARC domain-containing protein n=1 Tax=Triticum urartu TaxID=4572 RepID=A0A8R7V2H6_TRIUA
MRLQELVEELNLLANKKSLIVLDDISTTAEWDLVRSCLKNAGTVSHHKGKNVAKHCSGEDTNMYRLEGLKDAAALDIFKKKVFKNKRGEVNLDLHMEEQAKLILKKCDGLPLAISTIGGFLATRPKTAIEWRKMHGRISAELEINPELRTIKTVLMRSYDGLLYHLKLCFLYMSIFPEDYIIKRKRLVRRWIAEGYCKEMHGMTAEEIGDNYFDELLDRSMILPREGVNHHSGKNNSCQLHDIIREICISKAREENLVFTLEEGCCLSSIRGPIRHLAISSNWKRDTDVFDMLDLSHVRSLTVYGEWRPYFISEKMRFLRVLDLEDTLRFTNHNLDGIGKFYHLRYLSIRNGAYIWYLPNSIGNLSYLQTLDIKGTHI